MFSSQRDDMFIENRNVGIYSTPTGSYPPITLSFLYILDPFWVWIFLFPSETNRKSLLLQTMGRQKQKESRQRTQWANLWWNAWGRAGEVYLILCFIFRLRHWLTFCLIYDFGPQISFVFKMSRDCIALLLVIVFSIVWIIEILNRYAVFIFEDCV